MVRLVRTEEDLAGLEPGEDWAFDGWPEPPQGGATPEEIEDYNEASAAAHAEFIRLSAIAEQQTGAPEEAPAVDSAQTEEPDDMSDLINKEALGPTLRNISKGGQYGLAIAVGILAFIVVYALLTNVLGIQPEAGGSLTGIVGGGVILALWWCVRSDNRKAEAADNPLLVTTNTARDVGVTLLAFGGIVVVGGVIGALPGVLIAAGAATIVGWWSGRWVWDGISQ